MIRTPLMNVMTAAARKAGRGLRRDFGEVALLQVSRKGPGDFVSAADHAAEAILRAELERARPGYGFRLEEGGVVQGADRTHTWHVDPLDGTTNFLHGLPHFAVSIGLEREGQLVAGVVYNPATEEMFIAERGQGAYLNNQRLRVAARTDLGDCLLACGIPNIGRGDLSLYYKHTAAVAPKVAGLRRFGATALDLAYVAAGRVDGYWDHRLKTWDVAAGVVLVREAGGFVTDPKGGEDVLAGDVVAGNEAVHKALLATLKAA